jgi:hypothetical protein
MATMGINIGRFVDGMPNGYLYENSWTILERYMPELDPALFKKLIRALISQSHRYGLCGVHSLEGKSSAKLVHDISDDNDFYFTWYYIEGEPNREYFLSDKRHFLNGGIKLFSDGSLGSDSAWMFENTKLDMEYVERLREQMIPAIKNDIQIAVHAIGDLAVHVVATLISELNTSLQKKIRHRIEHLQAVRPCDINLLATANIYASMQPVHLKTDIEPIQKKWKIACDYAFTVRSIQNVVPVAFGSDSPVETLDPFEGIRWATNRNGFLSSEAISFEEALCGYTLNPSIITGREALYGMIKPDMIANLIVIEDSRSPEVNNSVVSTIIDGRIVF